jgi:hypothetical protein
MSGLPLTQYNAYHMEWGFTLLECILTRENRQAGGEGVRPGYTAETSTHSPPQIFLRQLARMRACPTLVACPTVASAIVV